MIEWIFLAIVVIATVIKAQAIVERNRRWEEQIREVERRQGKRL